MPQFFSSPAVKLAEEYEIYDWRKEQNYQCDNVGQASMAWIAKHCKPTAETTHVKTKEQNIDGKSGQVGDNNGIDNRLSICVIARVAMVLAVN